ncbi:MAG: hypothetical protein WBG57_09070, partial [Ornithinimicrobium sp.]
AVLGPLPLGGVSGCAGENSVQVTGSVSAERAAAYRTLAQRGIGAVEDLWGQGSVPQPIRLDLPANAAAWALATGRPISDQVYAASTVWQESTGRIVVHPATWNALSPQGRSAVITHEVTHLAMGPSTRVPWWITEGLAEYTAHRASKSSLEDIAGSAWKPLIADPPSRWPRPSRRADSWQNYAPAWLACVFLARTYDEKALLTMHSELVGGSPLEVSMRDHFDRGSGQLQQDWSRWLGEQ